MPIYPRRAIGLQDVAELVGCRYAVESSTMPPDLAALRALSAPETPDHGEEWGRWKPLLTCMNEEVCRIELTLLLVMVHTCISSPEGQAERD